MKKVFTFVTAIVLTIANLNAQDHSQALTGTTPQQNMKPSEGSVYGTLPYILLWMINPIVVYEDKHIDLGLTKEVSLYFIPYIRFAGEYSRIFRKHNKNHIRASVNAEIPLLVTDYALVMSSVGGGYFTDLTHNGYFPQASVSLMLFPAEHIGTNIYLKSRYTFIIQEEKSNIIDLSYGAGLMFWF